MKHFYVVLLLNLLGAYPIMTHSPFPNKYTQTDATHTHRKWCANTQKKNYTAMQNIINVSMQMEDFWKKTHTEKKMFWAEIGSCKA